MLAIALGVVSIVALIVLRETYAPTILERKVKKLRKETGNMNLRSKLDLQLGPKELFIRAITRPTKLLFLSPICVSIRCRTISITANTQQAFMSLYMAFVVRYR